MQIACTSCGADVPFRSRSSVFAVCPFCQSMLVRSDLNLETMGKMAELPPDMSPLQVGTRGRFEKTSFEILGKHRKSWEHGSWNEYYVLLENGKEGWLGEAQGFYMMSFPVEGTTLPEKKYLAPGVKVAIGKETFEVDDIKKCQVVGAQGELPLATHQGKTMVSVDLTGPGKIFAGLEYVDDKVFVYQGRYVEFEELSLTNLREIDGW